MLNVNLMFTLQTECFTGNYLYTVQQYSFTLTLYSVQWKFKIASLKI